MRSMKIPNMTFRKSYFGYLHYVNQELYQWSVADCTKSVAKIRIKYLKAVGLEGESPPPEPERIYKQLQYFQAESYT